MSDSTTERLEPAGGGRSVRVGRRVFLAAVAGGVSSLLWGRGAWSHVSGVVSPVGSLIPLIPTKGWRIYTVADSMPKFDEADWQLTVGGLVTRPSTFSYDELLALPKVEQVSTFHCVTGWSVKNVHWGGVRIRDVLAHAAPKREAHGLRFVSAEQPYDDFLTLRQAGLTDVMLAYEMDGKPLPRVHGAPLRLVIPEMYGYKNVKWVNRIELVPKAGSGYWEELGYDRDAWVGRSNGYGT
jgi:DMSO/TMAO reductase YedYZ molybdopterin-dependent catalytic subunit